MKKILSMLLVVAMCMSLFCVNAVADDSIKIVINGVEQVYDQMPVIVEGRTLVPMRGIFEALGAKVEWIDYTKTVVGTRDRQHIKLKLNSDVVAINGIEQKIDVPAQIINSRTMVPVRFISEVLGETVEWDGNTRTVYITSDYLKNVAVSDKLAILPSTMHRPVPTEFTRTNALDDLIYYDTGAAVTDEYLNQITSPYTVIFTHDEFLEKGTLAKSGSKEMENAYGSASVIDVSGDGVGVDKALRVVTHTVPTSTDAHTWRFGEILKDRYAPGDNLLVTFKVRLVEGGEAGCGAVYPQIQELKSGKWNKVLFEKANVPADKWTSVYFPVVMAEHYNDLAVRFGYCEASQTVDVANFRILNYGQEILGDHKLPQYYGSDYEELEENAEWRKEALANIEKVRKGDFKVVVKDKSGNVVPDAKVTFNMFESAFPLGTAFNGNLIKNEKMAEQFTSWFNGGVIEHNMKWGPYEDDVANGKTTARDQLNRAYDLGMIYARGHVMLMDYPSTPSGTVLLPDDLVKNMLNKDFCDIRIRGWIDEISDKFAGEFIEWDVFNETFGHTTVGNSIYGTHGPEYYKEIADWARLANPDTDLMFVEGALAYKNMNRWKEQVFEPTMDLNPDIDGVGLQSHFGDAYYSPLVQNDLYNYIADKYNKSISLTEYTVASDDLNYVANYTRDFFITAFANEHINGIYLWKWYKASSYTSPVMTDKDFNLLPAGELILDLYYNKWWTRNANTTTDANGEGTVRGFYGNYDVTVEANGQTKTIMAAFHKGYENVLTITLEG